MSILLTLKLFNWGGTQLLTFQDKVFKATDVKLGTNTLYYIDQTYYYSLVADIS